MKVREAVLEDAKAVARINVDTWRSTYRGLIPDDILDKMSYYERAKQVEKFLEAGSRKIFTYVAEVASGIIIGYIMAGPERFDASFDGEIYAVYVLDDFQRKGVGRLLIREVAERLQGEGISSVIVRVLSASPYRSFYKLINGRELETKPADLGGFHDEITAYGWENISKLTKI